ncbi:hypothetical protein Nepgr_020036 [Nepenthes gracilis]|uniref:ASCH domain-containing protein n=1 Tax=Nepenthes gracilis TaxID=150966 RepID=A0AAD3XVS4_NEPGR|nr:hypothetical protein Nepgr_020036 [Nepenthes gracilis]
MEGESASGGSSPVASHVQLSDCIEELLKFVLQSSIDGTPGLDIGLSKDYCSGLLKDEPSSDIHILLAPHIYQGVPPYPLYKCLASALLQFITSGCFCWTYEEVPLNCEDISLIQTEEKWKKLILDKGSELKNMLKSINLELHVQEPFFSQLNDGVKTIEGRCSVDNYNRIQSGALILFNKCLLSEVQDIHHYASFMEMLEAEGLEKVLPGVVTIQEGVQIYRKFYTEEKERSNGVIALCICRPATRPDIVLAEIISGLSYDGIQRLLGLKKTAGTISEALPPARSTLLSSFMLPHKSNVKSCTLTDGARALAKHGNRNSSNYWGKLEGNVRRISGAVRGGWSFKEMEALGLALFM